MLWIRLQLGSQPGHMHVNRAHPGMVAWHIAPNLSQQLHPAPWLARLGEQDRQQLILKLRQTHLFCAFKNLLFVGIDA